MAEDYAEVIAAIKSGSKVHLHQVYVRYRISFIEWAQARFRCTEEDALDVYQEVIIIFYENIVAGKVIQLRSKLRTYLFGIGKNLISKRYQRNQRMFLLADHTVSQQWEDEADEKLELNDRQQLMRQALDQLGENCRDLLLLFYYRRFSTEAIRETLNYKNTDVVKSQKARCMRKLRQWMEAQYDKGMI